MPTATNRRASAKKAEKKPKLRRPSVIEGYRKPTQSEIDDFWEDDLLAKFRIFGYDAVVFRSERVIMLDVGCQRYTLASWRKKSTLDTVIDSQIAFVRDGDGSYDHVYQSMWETPEAYEERIREYRAKDAEKDKQAAMFRRWHPKIVAWLRQEFPR